jgi:hypothetical protein
MGHTIIFIVRTFVDIWLVVPCDIGVTPIRVGVGQVVTHARIERGDYRGWGRGLGGTLQ